ncbi:MAG: aspartate carbamoyltransferase catalytic subunit [Deltaproteobacteria bacterium]|jgi:aspartate carbamoyltransferase catalytic subunit|nr:aspartate carbamoyltransferase catalytic subunit [Deltaproteobacteria bacterium]MCK4791129.1 aspartate carbamoyltransferase catalytic subunit [Desulfobacteraceae bacterium]MBW1736179.1 aspartate carbamoyltransferase catalytic subunit [Deltaproteobacteria bacterium]MBW1908800.1 aspartate carbamoyltransferase catalytic subunit [Deltaproteobacteria bacterium]MBW2032682.1 aspartate carbamoyltransferase catalytic subunit [Deltaproteobacteria bacterium]
MEQLSVEDIELILDTAESLKEISTRDIKKVPTLRGKSVINFFYEPSTRTRTSFEMAAKRLSADTVSLSASGSSMVKGETLVDTARNLQAMNPDLIVLRHSSSGAPHLLARELKAGIINAGDGINEHPTQALLDLYTIREKKGKIKGLKVAIIGDISHSRVARSNIIGLTRMGAEVTVSGPPTMIPVDIETLGVRVVHDPVEAVKKKDVIMLLRMQLERQSKALFPGLREYASFFGLSMDVMKGAKDDVIVMHPGPMNRGVEITSEVADGPYSVILDQVTNGVAVRMAILYLLIGGSKE